MWAMFVGKQLLVVFLRQQKYKYMDTLLFLLIYLLMIVIATITIKGFYDITRGRWVTNEKDEKVWTGKLFNFWHKYWQQHTEKIIFYKNEMFRHKWKKIKEFLPDSDIFEFNGNSIEIYLTKNEYKEFQIFAKEKGVNITVRELEHSDFRNPVYPANTLISIFDTVKIYKFSEYLRDPLGLCITCFASVYGSLMWVAFYNILQVFWVKTSSHTLALFFEVPMYIKVAYWVIFCLSLAATLTATDLLTEKLKR